jgi:DNA-binding MarR family transcriptional regulator
LADTAEIALRQNEAILKLIARLAFKEAEIKSIVSYKKKGDAPDRYVNGYNACNGMTSVADLAKIIRVAPQTLSPILQEWEEEGIIYKYKESAEGVFYKRIMRLDHAQVKKRD